MHAFAQLAEVLLSWPAVLFWLALLFRTELVPLLGRLRVVRSGPLEGRFDEAQPQSRRAHKR